MGKTEGVIGEDWVMWGHSPQHGTLTDFKELGACVRAIEAAAAEIQAELPHGTKPPGLQPATGQHADGLETPALCKVCWLQSWGADAEPEWGVQQAYSGGMERRGEEQGWAGRAIRL